MPHLCLSVEPVIYALEAHHQSEFFKLVKVHLSDQPLQVPWDFTGKKYFNRNILSAYSKACMQIFSLWRISRDALADSAAKI